LEFLNYFPGTNVADPDLGCVKNQDPDLGFESGMSILPDHVSESLETIFWVKILIFFDADPFSGSGKLFDPGYGMEISGSATLPGYENTNNSL
jgi:hypothetical protein